MSSRYRLVTTLGDVEYDQTACYAQMEEWHRYFYHSDVITNSMIARIIASKLRLQMATYEVTVDKVVGKLAGQRITSMYIGQAHDEARKKVSNKMWTNLHTALKGYPAFSPYILPMTDKGLRRREIGIKFHGTPWTIAYAILWILRMYDEQYQPYIGQATKLFPILGANKAVMFLFMTQGASYDKLSRMTYHHKTSSEPLYGQPRTFSTPLSGTGGQHQIGFMSNGIVIPALVSMLRGSLDYFTDNRPPVYRQQNLGEDLSKKVSLIAFYSPTEAPLIPHHVFNEEVGQLPSPYYKEAFINYFNTLEEKCLTY